MSLVSIFMAPSDPYTYLMDSTSLSGLPLADIDVSAEEYLQFAAADLASSTKQGFINGVGNVKRALHLMIDSLLNSYGLWAKNKKLGFPGKLKLLENAGLFALSILETLNLERNVVEHEYRVPTKGRVQEMIDIGRLMLLVTQRMTEYVPNECRAGWREGDIQGVVQLNSSAGLLSFYRVTGPTTTTEVEGRQVTTLNNIRTFGGALSPGVEIAPSAMWEHKLSLSNMADWAPVIKPIVELSNFRQGLNRAVIHDNMLNMSLRISVPYDDMVNRLAENAGPIRDWSNFDSGSSSGANPNTAVE
jgi:hypothetical protein